MAFFEERLHSAGTRISDDRSTGYNRSPGGVLAPEQFSDSSLSFVLFASKRLSWRHRAILAC